MDDIPLGWRSNLVPLAALPRDVVPLEYLDVCCQPPWFDRRTKSKNDDLVREIASDPAKQKLFARVVGCWGKLRHREDLHVQIPEHEGRDEEHWYYETHYNAGKSHDCIHREDQYIVPINRYYAYMAVVLSANLFITDAINHIHANTGVYPCMIKTDCLTYTRSDSVVAQLQALVDNPESILKWHWQEMPATICAERISPPLEIDTSGVYRGHTNVTLTGIPGAGKTYRGLGLGSGAAAPPEVVATYNNRGVARLAATCLDLPLSQRPRCMTVHRLAKCGLVLKRQSYHDMRYAYPDGTVVMIDEYQSVPQAFWSVFFFLHERGVRFRFVGDYEQVDAVDPHTAGGYVPVWTPFMGEYIRLTTNYRNDPTVTQWAQQVLAQTFNAHITVHPGFIQDDMNLAFRNSTVDYINDHFVRENGLMWGGPGKYLANVTSHYRRVYKGQVLTREGDEMTRPDGSRFVLPVVSARGYSWGWATTIHQSVGSTIPEDYTIWDYVPGLWDPAYKKLLYTAITRAKTSAQISFAGPLKPLFHFHGVPGGDEGDDDDIVPRCDQ
jgi:hypothetical protein